MEFFFFFYCMGLRQTAFFPIPWHIPLYICATFGGGECLLVRQAGFITPSPPLASWRTSSLGISVCGNQLMLHTICESPLEGFYERSHARACLSLPTRGWPPHPTASPGLALWFLTLSSKCLRFNRPNFQLSPCSLEVSLSHPEQICFFFFPPFLFVLLSSLLNNRFFPPLPCFCFNQGQILVKMDWFFHPPMCVWLFKK